MTNLPNPSPAATGVTGVDVTAAFWNAQVRDAINFLANPPLLVATDPGTNTTTIANGSVTKIKLPTVGADTYSGWDVTNNQYTVALQGWYQITGGVSILNVTNGLYVLAGVLYNGSALPNSNAESPTVPTGDLQQTPIRSVHQYCNVGDTLALYGQTGATGNKTNPTSTLEIRWVHS